MFIVRILSRENSPRGTRFAPYAYVGPYFIRGTYQRLVRPKVRNNVTRHPVGLAYKVQTLAGPFLSFFSSILIECTMNHKLPSAARLTGNVVLGGHQLQLFV